MVGPRVSDSHPSPPALSLFLSRFSSSDQPPDRPSAKGKERRPLGVFYIVHRGNRRREDEARVDGFASTKRRMLIQRLNIHLASLGRCMRRDNGHLILRLFPPRPGIVIEPSRGDCSSSTSTNVSFHHEEEHDLHFAS